MSTTAQVLYNRALAILDEINADTGIPDPDTTEDYLARAPYLISTIQTELLPYARTVEKYEIACKPFDNMFSEEFVVKYHEADDVSEYAESGGAKAYYFECDGTGTAYIEDFTSSWNILSTVTLTEPTSGFTAYKGIVTSTTGATRTRIRFSGSYYYAYQNFALFDVGFTSSAKIPDYNVWIKCTMPTTFHYIDNVIAETANGCYITENAYKIEKSGNTTELYRYYDFEGKLKVQYRSVPAPVTALTQTMEMDDSTVNIAAYMLALAFIKVEEKDGNSFQTYLQNKILELKNLAAVPKPIGSTEIIDVYGGI